MNTKKQNNLDKVYIRMAKEWANLSHCERKKVGALIVKNGMIISDGYNGTPNGFNNCCEEMVAYGEAVPETATKWEVLHAEANAMMKCAKHGTSCKEATLYLTMSPCKECSKLIHQAGISRVVYHEDYHNKDGLKFLSKANIEIKMMDKI
jgi:dCMP deaminase